MGCGASAHVQGTSPLAAGAEQSAANQEARGDKPSPIAEDVRTVQDQGSKEVGQPTGVPAVGGAPGANPDGGPAETQLVQSFKSPSSSEVPNGLVGSGAPGDEQSRLDQQSDKLVLTTSFDRKSPGALGLTNGGVLDPAVTPNSSMATVTLLADASGFAAQRLRYTNELDLAINAHSYDLEGGGNDSDDEDELAALFTLQAWKRYYGYNKKKPADLLKYFWKRFPSSDCTCFCLSYRNQDLLLTQYMAENCINGYIARVEDMSLSDSLFLQMYALHDDETDQYRIVGLLLVHGQSVPPQLAALSWLDGFVYQKADTNPMLVRQFLSALLVGRSPLNSLVLLSCREVA